jgi:hypothetical protein
LASASSLSSRSSSSWCRWCESRLADIDRVISGLEGAALTAARALQEISSHSDSVYEAMRRIEDADVGQFEPGQEPTWCESRENAAN